jgi:hypothetical protein
MYLPAKYVGGLASLRIPHDLSVLMRILVIDAARPLEPARPAAPR